MLRPNSLNFSDNMYRILIAMNLAMSLTLSALGQGTYAFINYVRSYGLDEPVFDASGNRLFGTNYVAMLYGGVALDSLNPAGSEGGGTVPPVPFTYLAAGQAGYFGYPRYVTIRYIAPGDAGWLQVRAWDARLGDSYEAVKALNIGGYGESRPFIARSGGIGGGVPSLPGVLIGLESFSLRPGTEILIQNIRRVNDQIVVDWYGAFKRYQLQQTSALNHPWENLGQPTTHLSATNSIGGEARFFRVLGLLE